MIDLCHRIILAWGWERRLIAFLSGATGALAMAPVDFLPALVVCFVPAIWLLDGSAAGISAAGTGRLSWRSLWSAAAIGWWWGFGYLVAGLWWIGSAFFVDADEFLWALPLGIFGLQAGLAIFAGLGFALARLLWSPGPMRIVSFAFAVGLGDWLRGHVFTGFPWNPFGQALGDFLLSAQAASIVGVDGLSLLALLIFASPALMTDAPARGLRWRVLVAPVLALGLIGGFGAVRLGLNGGLSPQLDPGHLVPDVRLRIVQPNVAITDRRTGLSGQAVLDLYLALSERPGVASPTHLIWPESPFPFLLAQQPQALKQIASHLGGRSALVTGAIRADPASQTGAPMRYYNAIQVVLPDASISASYDKVHLVPFGEYLPGPFRAMLTAVGLRQFVQLPGGFESGVIRTPLIVPGLPPILPLLCYEAVFSSEINADRSVQEMILNPTNDAWFGRSTGPYQHFAEARLRSIEQGLPLIRVANTGISAAVDPFGRLLASLPIGVADVIDTPLPKAIAPTVFVRFGMLITYGSFLILAVASVFGTISGSIVKSSRV